MKLADLLKNTEALEAAASMDMEVTGVSYDSRTTKKGDVFVAVRGFASDGHRFIAAAAERGAACVVCEEKPETDIPYVLVADSRRALAEVSAEFFGRPAERLRMIGVTGTNGKTTTTNLIKTMLEHVYGAKVGLIGTNCNMIGGEVLETERTTPESYELQKLLKTMADAGCEYVVMEVSSHALCLDRVRGITFEVGVFTNLTRDHLDFH
ncbi:MAG: UDP-N-acetylmuramoyl-L-alanyl-D-glutamate--2,6-diaminopimelate ligase, partial [Oscillospiraceae bacterium]|nr:UDP-N-acetylmuramoyl-L-alanyl-D-glutamate--2,6-diaminopimelate ligase [Oscillospiraceae bacterium]